MHETQSDLDEVVQSLIETLHISGRNIDLAREGLLAMVDKDGPEARAAVESYLYVFWTNMTGSYGWS